MTEPSRPDDAFLESEADALVAYEPWLRLLARLQVGDRFRSKFDPSDVVQQTLMEACRALPQFRGEGEPQLMAWLRQILARVLAHEVRRYRGTQGRDIAREVSLDRALAESSRRLGDLLTSPESSPSARAGRHELERSLAEALERLPDDYREVILLRNIEALPHEEVAARMGRGVGAVRMLWLRALDRLRRELDRPEQKGSGRSRDHSR